MSTKDQDLRRQALVFYEEDMQAIEAILTAFLKKSAARCALLVDQDGHMITAGGDTQSVDLDTINFEFGSAAISDSEIGKLEGVASAIERLLDQNPGETFLIEGHTDAVGSNVANLALSDRRAVSVAVILTDVYQIPPENLVTQGYGEQYLKVQTEEPSRINRRVSVRRVTPLLSREGWNDPD